MITTNGSLHIKRYLAGFVPSIAQSIAFGIGNSAESSGSTYLQFEVGRVNIELTSYDFVNNKLIFKAPLPDEFSGTIYEYALYSLPSNVAAGEFGSRLLTTFDSASETWTVDSSGAASTFNTANMRIGADALRQAPAASATATDDLKEISLDLSGYSSNDKFILAFNSGNAFASAVKVRFLTDASNYYEVNFGSATAGYKIVEVLKGAATATGTPSWANITELRVLTTATSGGAAQIDFDGLRIEDADTVNSDYVMVSREVPASSYVKAEGANVETEYALDINV